MIKKDIIKEGFFSLFFSCKFLYHSVELVIDGYIIYSAYMITL